MNSKLIDLNTNISFIVLNINDPNDPIKSQRFSNWIKKTMPNYMLSIRNS